MGEVCQYQSYWCCGQRAVMLKASVLYCVVYDGAPALDSIYTHTHTHNNMQLYNGKQSPSYTIGVMLWQCCVQSCLYTLLSVLDADKGIL